MSVLNARRVGYALCMAALLAAGLSTGTRLYYLIFFMLLAMLILSVASVLWTLFSVRFELKGIRARVTRGESVQTLFTLKHLSLLPVSAIQVQLSVPSAAQEVNVTVPPFTARTFRQVIDCPHRGVYEAGVTRITVTDVFDLISLSRRPNLKLVRMEVRPRVSDVSPLVLQNVDMGPEFRSTASEDNASPSDVRKWQDGDELKKVHWKLSLRNRELMVRTYEESARPDTLIIPDLGQASGFRDQQLTLEDLICEAALNAAKAQLNQGYPVRLPLTNARPSELSGQTPADFAPFIDAMIKVGFDSPYEYERVLMLMQARLQRTGGAILITARLNSKIADIVLRMQLSGITTRLIWVSDDAREETLTMLERLKMAAVQVERLDPWGLSTEDQTAKAERDFDDEYD